jgi:hypothetical protein
LCSEAGFRQKEQDTIQKITKAEKSCGHSSSGKAPNVRFIAQNPSNGKNFHLTFLVMHNGGEQP